ncbi:MAG: hypothetical protein MJE68_03210 [Proteobacteria bacterium]|nr:hypothetical protein [Pseudomonadota bacterium]
MHANNSCIILYHWAGLNITTIPYAYFLKFSQTFSTGGLADGRIKITKRLP